MTSFVKALGLSQGGVISIVGAGGKTSLMFRLASELAAAKTTVLTTTTTKIFTPGPEQSPLTLVSKSVQTILRQSAGLMDTHSHLTAGAGRLAAQPEKLVGFPPHDIDRLRQAGLFRWILVEADGAAHRPLKAPEVHEPVVPESSQWVIAVVGLNALGQPLNPQWVFRHERYAALTGLVPGQSVTAASVVRAAEHPAGFYKGCTSQVSKILLVNTLGDPGRIAAGRNIAQQLIKTEKIPGFKGVVIGCPMEPGAVIEYHAVV
jgi:probable selenium-dependent hydroxylase accessory protein YqeC